ncbi:FAD:protein FMN transferase [Marinospirillum perlucidum]|uniref:FAD:protein FMN transferase n=1 Tax=Marinospirillum perlucidum TaxID=1982602 RepID=UPI000DF1ECDD|nr:FAD:protein FMN transferase [Marinospirillum perlucidum]
MRTRQVKVSWQGSLFLARFDAMASPCEILLALPREQQSLAEKLARIAAEEVWRIEATYSRYRPDNFFARLHQQAGQWQEVDAETTRLLDFADQAWQLSGGLFDITSGILRRVWSFDGSDRLPDPDAVAALLPRIGWDQVGWESRTDSLGGRLFLPSGMELDLGGLGKEYAADRALGLALQALQAALGSAQSASLPGLLVNLGGDLAANAPPSEQAPWRVGIESTAVENQAASLLELTRGGLATSGDSRRYLVCDGKRYGHLLNPKTGWPLQKAPRSVTVSAPTCVQSGLVASLALLQGEAAETFLKQTGLAYWLAA